jgi:hypothetical protein
VIRQRLSVRGVILLELDRLSNVAEADAVAEVIATRAGKLSGNLVVIEPGGFASGPWRRDVADSRTIAMVAGAGIP